jgi:hypothetical protein
MGPHSSLDTAVSCLWQHRFSNIAAILFDGWKEFYILFSKSYFKGEEITEMLSE